MSSSRIIKKGAEARQEMLKGVTALAEAVKVTLGPSGTNVYIRSQHQSTPYVTKDGVTVAREVYHEEPLPMMAIESMKNVANLSDELAGDGTTTATIIAETLFRLGMEDLEKGKLNLIDIKRGMDYAAQEVIKILQEKKIDIKEDYDKLKEVCLVSSNNDDQISDLVVEAYKKAGNQGVVNIKRSRNYDSYISSVDGMVLPTGYRAVYYINDQHLAAYSADKTWILATNTKITEMSENLQHLCMEIAEKGQSLLIICAGMTEAISDVLIRQRTQNGFRVCVVNAPFFGEEQSETLKDLGVFLGGQVFIDNELDFNKISKDKIFEVLPRCAEVLVQDQTTAFKGPWYDIPDKEERETKEKAIDAARSGRVQQIRDSLEKKHHNEYEKNFKQARISRLSEGMCYINIAAFSDAEFIEKQHRVQDALYAIKAAAEEGIVPGGGTALLSISHMLKDMTSNNPSKKRGVEIVLAAITEPFKTVYHNVNGKHPDENGEDYKACLETWDFGFEGRKNQIVESMIAEGIVDPVKVTRIALENAVSIIGMMLTTSVAIVDQGIYEQAGYGL